MAKISVMGTGSWGTALAILLHNNGHQVMLWSAHPEKAASLNQTREDPKKPRNYNSRWNCDNR